jgi:hypothetical protein
MSIHYFNEGFVTEIGVAHHGGAERESFFLSKKREGEGAEGR